MISFKNTTRAILQSSIILAVLLSAQTVYPCSWAVGYFFQVTDLRGKIVGVNDGDFRHRIRWLRQEVRHGNVKLTLYEYRWPFEDLSELRVVRVASSDEDGNFAFGKLPDGHYELAIETPWKGLDLFSVQISQLPQRTTSVTIDISPNYPDCTGGHEFIIETN